MMTGKPTTAKVGQRKARYLESGDAALVKQMLPYG
jgi:ribosomal protein L35